MEHHKMVVLDSRQSRYLFLQQNTNFIERKNVRLGKIDLCYIQAILLNNVWLILYKQINSHEIGRLMQPW